MELGELVRLALAGDAEAPGRLYEKTYDRVYYLALRLLKNPEDALDVVQESYIAALEHLDTLKNPEAFLPWLYQITANRCKKHYRRQSRLAEAPQDAEDGRDYFDTLPETDEKLLPESVLDSAGTRELVLQLVDELPIVQRECVLLYYFSGLTVEQIAQVQECSVGTVKSRLNYGRQKLREGVLAMEDRDGIRLHTLVPMGLLFSKFASELPAQEVFQGAWQSISKGLGLSAAAGTAAAGTSAASSTAVRQGLFHTLKAKLIAGVTAAALAVGGGALVYSQLPKPVAFADPAFEQNLRVVLDRPEGSIYASDLERCNQLNIFDDGVSFEGGAQKTPGTVPLGSLEDAAKLPRLYTLYYWGTDFGLLETLAECPQVESLAMTGQAGRSFCDDLEFLDKLPNLRNAAVLAAAGTDLAPLERRTGLMRCSINSNGSLSLDLSALEELRSLRVAADVTYDAGCQLTVRADRELPRLRQLSLFGGDLSGLRFLENLPNLEALEIYSPNLSALDLTSLGTLSKLRACSLLSADHGTVDLSPLSACPALEVYYTANCTVLSPPPQAAADTQADLPIYNRVTQEVNESVDEEIMADHATR